jgi:hypothetical protein
MQAAKVARGPGIAPGLLRVSAVRTNRAGLKASSYGCGLGGGDAFVLFPAGDELAPVRLLLEVVIEDVVGGRRGALGLAEQGHARFLG